MTVINIWVALASSKKVAVAKFLISFPVIKKKKTQYWVRGGKARKWDQNAAVRDDGDSRDEKKIYYMA